MRTSRLLALALASCALHFRPAIVQAAPKADTTYIQKVADGEIPAAGMPEKTGKNGRWARSWTKTDGGGFLGKPKPLTVTENTDTNLVFRYTRFSTEYNVEFHSPVWGAYTLDATTVGNDLAGEHPASDPVADKVGQFSGGNHGWKRKSLSR